MILGFFGSTWENKVQTAYISGIVRQTGEEACAYNNKPGPTTGVITSSVQLNKELVKNPMGHLQMRSQWA